MARKLVQRLPRPRKAPLPAPVPADQILVAPETPEDRAAALNACVNEAQTLVRAHAAAGRHPMPLFEAFLFVIAFHTPALGGDGLIDGFCVALRNCYANRKEQIAQEKLAAALG